MTSDQVPSSPPAPTDPQDAARWAHTRLRRRVLSGAWLADLERRLQQEVGTTRREAWGVPKLTANPLRTMCRELAALHLVEPEVRAPGGDKIFGALAAAITDAALWARMPRFQALTIGCREYLWRLTVRADGSAQYRPVPPDMVTATASPDAPDQPVALRELRWRDPWGWCWDILDMDERAPTYRVERFGGEDVTTEALGGRMDGDAYPYRDSDGTPFLPYVLYHADRFGACLWDWLDMVETVESTLDLAVNYTFLGHVLRDASWPQRWALNARPVGWEVPEGAQGAGRLEVTVDPSVVSAWQQIEESPGSPQLGQWAASADVEKMEAVIAAMANRVAIEAGLPPSDIQRLGGTARSGYAISLSNEGKRVAARRFAPSFRRSDEETVAKTAILLNRATGARLPESGYGVIYRDLPLSPEELRERRANLLEMTAAGLMSPVDAYMELHPGLSREQALADIRRIRQERALLAEPAAGLPLT